MVYQVSFYSEENALGHTGEFINDYGRFIYDIYLDVNVSDEEPTDVEYVQENDLWMKQELKLILELCSQ